MVDKGVIVEFDFTALDGSSLLYETAKGFLNALDGIPFDISAEAKYFAGENCLDGFTKFFASVKTKKTAAKATRDFTAAYQKALVKAIPGAVTAAFRNFVSMLTDKGVRVVIATAADLERVRPAFEGILSDQVMLYCEEAPRYGTVRRDSWRRICAASKMPYGSTTVVTGSGLGVKAALYAGMGSMAVVSDHVAYQDFGGASEVVTELSGKTAKKLLSILRL